MNEFEIALINFLELFQNHSTVQEYEQSKKRILNNQELLQEIKEFQKLSKNDAAYLEKKKHLLNSPEYKNYVELELKIQYWTLQMSDMLKKFLQYRDSRG